MDRSSKFDSACPLGVLLTNGALRLVYVHQATFGWGQWGVQAWVRDGQQLNSPGSLNLDLFDVLAH